MLISEAVVKQMKPGSVIVDLAVEQGGNCPLSEPGRVVEKHGVKIIGHLNVPGRIPESASSLYARNLLNFVQTLVDKENGRLEIDLNDEIIKGTLLAYDGKAIHPTPTG